MTRRIITMALILVAVMGIAFTSARPAYSSNGGVVPHTDALVTVVTHGHTAGTVTACISASGGPIVVLSFGIHDWSRHVYTRLRGAEHAFRSGERYCTTTGEWFRFMRSDLTASIVNASDGAPGRITMPLSDYCANCHGW